LIVPVSSAPVPVARKDERESEGSVGYALPVGPPNVTALGGASQTGQHQKSGAGEDDFEFGNSHPGTKAVFASLGEAWVPEDDFDNADAIAALDRLGPSTSGQALQTQSGEEITTQDGAPIVLQGKPLPVDNDTITVDSTRITADATHFPPPIIQSQEPAEQREKPMPAIDLAVEGQPDEEDGRGQNPTTDGLSESVPFPNPRPAFDGGQNLGKRHTSGRPAASVHASSWTGRRTLSEQVQIVRIAAPLAMSEIDNLVQLIEEKRFNDPETEAALNALRSMHESLGELISAVEDGQSHSAIKRLIEKNGRAVEAIKAQGKIFVAAPTMGIGLIYMISAILNIPVDSTLAAGIIGPLLGVPLLGNQIAKLKQSPQG
jgi:hypothetical protein